MGTVRTAVAGCVLLAAATAAFPAVASEEGAAAQSASAVRQPAGLEEMRALARELVERADFERSIEVYREIARLTPEDPRSHFELASTLAFLRLYAQAVEPIEAAIRLAPDYLEAYRVAEIIYERLERFDEAVAVTLEAARLGDITAMYQLTYYYDEGIGVPADERKVLEWMERAASNGHVKAMTMMEEIYRDGLLGEPVDADRAARWARRVEQEAMR